MIWITVNNGTQQGSDSTNAAPGALTWNLFSSCELDNKKCFRGGLPYTSLGVADISDVATTSDIFLSTNSGTVDPQLRIRLYSSKVSLIKLK